MRSCDNTSVGVLITNPARCYLMITRAKFPIGIAPVAGHVDEHGSPYDAALAETQEEVGLDVTSLDLVAEGWRGNVCRRASARPARGHQWWIFQAQTAGFVKASREETRGARWYSPAQLQVLTWRTASYARGLVLEEDWERQPGIEPVWCRWLVERGVVDLTEAELAFIETVAERRPARR